MAVTFTLRPDGAAHVEGTLPPPVTIALPCVRVGRGEDCDFCVLHPSVAPHHATLEQRGGLFLLWDEGSEGGTFLEGVGRLAPRVEHVVRSGSVVRLGAVTLELRFDASAGTSSSRGTMKLALRLVDEALARHDAGGVILAIREGPGRRKELRLREAGSYVVGRGRDADMRLEDLDVSRHHARVSLCDGKVFVLDLGSSNGTYLGPVRLERETESIWPAGSLLRLGGTSLGHESALEAVLRELVGPHAQDAGQGHDGPGEARGPEGNEASAQGENESPAVATALVPILSEAGAPMVEPPSSIGPPAPTGPPAADSFEKWMRLVILSLAAVVLMASAIGLWWVVRF